jgi:hypothetical protein
VKPRSFLVELCVGTLACRLLPGDPRPALGALGVTDSLVCHLAVLARSLVTTPAQLSLASGGARTLAGSRQHHRECDHDQHHDYDQDDQSS